MFEYLPGNCQGQRYESENSEKENNTPEKGTDETKQNTDGPIDNLKSDPNDQ